ncbi:unnamed protein product [Prunus armeniaca]
MGLEPKIGKLARSLTGFNGATSITIGMIDLDVHSPPVVYSQTFMVNDEISSYNRILGPTVDQQDRGHLICLTPEDLLPHP